MNMYQESKKRIDWVKLFLRVVIAGLMIALTIKLISMAISHQETKKMESNMTENLKLIDAKAQEYFNDENKPKESGKTEKVFLANLIKEEKMDVIKDEDGNACNMDKSFISITKLDTEYQLKSYLECEKSSDYLNTFIKIETPNITVKPTEETNTTTKKVTSAKTTTTKKKKYQIGFNTNGGEYLNDITVESGKQIPYKEPTRKGYRFIGWYYNGEKFDFNTKVKQNYVLVAKWVKE